MNYVFQVDDYDNKRIEIVEGENVDAVLKRVFSLKTRKRFFTDAEKNKNFRREY